jgi:hypothetical protein
MQQDRYTDVEVEVDINGEQVALRSEEVRRGSKNCVLCMQHPMKTQAPARLYKQLEATLDFDCTNVGCTFNAGMDALLKHNVKCQHQLLSCCVRYCPSTRLSREFKACDMAEHIEEHGNVLAIHTKRLVKAYLILRRLPIDDSGAPVNLDYELSWLFKVVHNGQHLLVQALLQDDSLAIYVTQINFNAEVEGGERPISQVKVKLGSPEQGCISRKINVIPARDGGASANLSIGDLMVAQQAFVVPASNSIDALKAFSKKVNGDGPPWTDYLALQVSVKLELENGPQLLSALRCRNFDEIPRYIDPFTKNRTPI